MRIFTPRAVIFAAFAVVAIGFAPNRALADIIPMNATDSGWYNSDGYHDSTNKNYIAGFASPTNYNDYFVFDLSAIQAPIFAAEIKLYMPISNPDIGNGYVGPASVFSLYEVQAPVSAVMQSQSGLSGLLIYADLGSGMVLGSTSVSSAANGTIVSINFNADGLAILNAGAGGLVAIGGSLATLGTLDQYAFGNTDENSQRQLIVATVPEPMAIIQVSVGLAGLLLHARSRRRAKVA